MSRRDKLGYSHVVVELTATCYLQSIYIYKALAVTDSSVISQNFAVLLRSQSVRNTGILARSIFNKVEFLSLRELEVKWIAHALCVSNFCHFIRMKENLFKNSWFMQLQDACSPPSSFSLWRGGRGRESDKLVLVKCLRNRGKEKTEVSVSVSASVSRSL